MNFHGRLSTMTDQRATITSPEKAPGTFSTSMLISGIRCLLAYVVFPWLLPVLGVTSGVGPGIGLVIGGIAIAFNLWSIARFMRSGHRLRWLVIPINLAVIGLLTFLACLDILDLAD